MKTFFRLTLACAVALLVAASPAGFAQTTHGDALYQDLGGKEGIRKMVDAFLPIVLDDPGAAFSTGTGFTVVFSVIAIVATGVVVWFGLRARSALWAFGLGMLLAEQFCQLSGGPCKYSGRDMKTTHEGMNITNAQFNALAEDLQTAMDRQGIASRVQNKLIAKLAPMQHEVVSK